MTFTPFTLNTFTINWKLTVTVLVQEMTEEALDKYVMTNAPRFCQKRPEIFDQPSESKKRERKAAPKTGGVYSSYTHTEVSDVELARGLSALVGAFFIASGTSGALKVLDWLDFCVPNADGEKQKLIKPSSFPFCHETLNSKVVDDLLPMASELESRVGYTYEWTIEGFVFAEMS